MNIDRRNFIVTSLVASTTIVVSRLSGQPANQAPDTTAKPPLAEVPRAGARQDLNLVFEFVRAGHNNLARVKELIAHDPKLVLASHDWGQGDWETALGGASHLGNREIARYLLSQGARIDSFCAAMLGEREVLLALLAANPSVATTEGPHGNTLLYHAAISGDVAMTQALKPHLAPKAKDYNQALHAAARGGHLAMTSWLLENGVTNPNTLSVLNKTPLAVALEKGFREVAEELRRHGATETN